MTARLSVRFTRRAAAHVDEWDGGGATIGGRRLARCGKNWPARCDSSPPSRPQGPARAMYASSVYAEFSYIGSIITSTVGSSSPRRVPLKSLRCGMPVAGTSQSCRKPPNRRLQPTAAGAMMTPSRLKRRRCC